MSGWHQLEYRKPFNEHLYLQFSVLTSKAVSRILPFLCFQGFLISIKNVASSYHWAIEMGEYTDPFLIKILLNVYLLLL